MKNSRRQFIFLSTTAATALLFNSKVQAQTMVSLSDPEATALGFVLDASKANKAKFPQYAAGQQCGSCVLYQGAAGSADGPCGLFPGKHVPSNGWCSGYTKKS
jgi:hypothetical protein